MEGKTERGWLSRRRALVIVLAVATAAALYLCFLMALPFLPALSMALALAVIARPLHRWVKSRVGNADVAAGLTLAAVVVVFVVPAVFVVAQIVPQAAAGLDKAQVQAQDGTWRERLDESATFGPVLHWIEENVDVAAEVQRVVLGMVGDVAAVVTGSVWAGLQILITLFALYYFLRDHDLVLAEVRSLLPLSERETDDMFRKIDDTIHATIFGSVLCAIIQGTMGGLMFWLLDMPAPLVWGLVMALLAIVPNLGTFVVWAPTAVFLALHGQWGKAVVLGLWGGVAIALIDNLLYPMLVGNRMRLHTVPVFFAIVGGLAVFGFAGVILGPVILAVTDGLIDVWRRRTSGGQTAETALPAAK